MTTGVSSRSFSDKSKLPSRGAGDLIDTLSHAVPDLNDAEAKVARIVLSNSEWVVQAPIKAVAQQAEVSEPTVLRMCRRIGLDGFKALKHRLAEDLILSRVLYGPELGGSDTSSNELIKVMLDSSMRALRGAAKSIDIAVLDEAAAAVVKARLIYCIGVGGSSQIATYSVVLRGYFCAQMSA